MNDAAPKRGALRPAALVCAISALVACGPPAWKGGIHAQLAWSAQGVRVLEVPDGPAGRAGLAPGDRIVSVDGKALAGRDSATVQRLLSGEVGSVAALEVLREGAPLTLRVERAPYAAKGVGK